ncbi:MAG: MFS transporter [Acetobacteraceae bacterium]|nr:MFS transporter [Acetobacteraceae bacterium]
MRPGIPIGLLALAGFASGSGMRLLDPLLPAVADSLEVSVASSSVLLAGFMLPYGLGQLVLGPLGDRLGKLRVVCGALLLYGLTVLACASAGSLPALVLWRAGSGLFAGAIIPLAMAYLGDEVPYEDRQATIGRFLTGMVMAQMLTGPAAGVIGEHTGWRGAFLVLGGLSLLIAATLATRLGRTLWQPIDQTADQLPGMGAYLSLLSRPMGRWLLICAFFDGLCLFGGAFPFVGAFLIETFGLTAGTSGLVVAGFGLGAFIYTRLARRLVRRFGERRLLLGGGLGLAVCLGGMAVAPDWQVGAGMQFLAGLLFYMFHGVLQARATEAMPEARGTAVSAYALALFMGQATGSLVFAVILAAVGYRAGFAAAALGLVALSFYGRSGLR